MIPRFLAVTSPVAAWLWRLFPIWYVRADAYFFQLGGRQSEAFRRRRGQQQEPLCVDLQRFEDLQSSDKHVRHLRETRDRSSPRAVRTTINLMQCAVLLLLLFSLPLMADTQKQRDFDVPASSAWVAAIKPARSSFTVETSSKDHGTLRFRTGPAVGDKLLENLAARLVGHR